MTMIKNSGLSAYITEYIFYDVFVIKLIYFTISNTVVELIFGKNIAFENLIVCIKYILKSFK